MCAACVCLPPLGESPVAGTKPPPGRLRTNVFARLFAHALRSPRSEMIQGAPPTGVLSHACGLRWAEFDSLPLHWTVQGRCPCAESVSCGSRAPEMALDPKRRLYGTCAF